MRDSPAPASGGHVQAVHDMPKPFEPAWWCRNHHLQTLWPYLMRRRPHVQLRRERVELPDGDFIDLDWTATDSTGPIVLVLHGLEGSSESKYALGLVKNASARGWRGAILNFRGCSGEPNRLPRSYHAGDTGDIAYVVDLLRHREPQVRIATVGYSLGGNAMLKWLGETREAAHVEAAVAVSVPFLLSQCARRMQQGFSRAYQWSLVSRLKASMRDKLRRMSMPFTREELARLHTFWEFDDRVVARLNGFTGVDDYYTRSSARQFLRNITVPTLLLHSRDDPFMTTAAIPGIDELSPTVEFELQRYGGHVGFVGGDWPWTAHYWLEQRIPDFLARYLD